MLCVRDGRLETKKKKSKTGGGKKSEHTALASVNGECQKSRSSSGVVRIMFLRSHAALAEFDLELI